MNSVTKGRAVIAFACAPLVVPAILVATRPFMNNGRLGPQGWLDIGSGFLMLCIFAYIGAAILGLPAFLLLRRLRANSLLSYCVAGAVVVLIFTAGISVLTGGIHQSQYSPIDVLKTITFALIAGGLSGGLFRAIASPS